MDIRLLKADEVDARVQSVKENGLILLLYKDARCDMKILDETFGIFGWQRKHEVINENLFCTVSIYDKEKQQWIEKQDVGTESYTEKEKGQASDSFKRACFNIGIGRELYTAPFVWINSNGDIKNGKCFTKFKVKEIGYNEQREINHLIIIDEKGNERYKLKGQINNVESKKYEVNVPPSKPLSEGQIKRLYAITNSKKIDASTVKEQVQKRFNKDVKDLSKSEYDIVCKGYESMKEVE